MRQNFGTNISLYLIIYIGAALSLSATTLSAGAKTTDQATADYDSLSHISSEKLMESGRKYFAQNEPAQALACFTVVSKRYKEQMDNEEAELCIRAMNNSACVYKYFYFEYIEAFKLFDTAYELCEKHGFIDFQSIVLVNLGDLLNDYSINYGSEKIKTQAHGIFEQCMEKAAKTKNWNLLVTAFFNLSCQDLELDLQKYKVILSKEIPDSTSDLSYVRLQYQGIKAYQQQDYAKARSCFTQQLQVISSKWTPERSAIASYINIAHTYEKEGNTQQAIESLHKALEIAEKGEINDQTAAICQLLSTIYKQIGQQERATAFHSRYLEIKEEIYTNRLTSIGELSYIHELEKEEKKAEQMAIRNKQQRQLLIAGTAILLLVIVFAVLLWRKNHLLTMAYKNLFEKNKEIIRIEQQEKQMRKDYEEKLSKYSHSNLTDEQRQTLSYRIRDILEAPDIICQQDFTLAKLAKLTDSNTTYVSQVINENYKAAFSIVLGNFRIKEACRRISDTEHYGNLTIDAIATSVGFKSRTSFFNAFKRETGLTPSEYQKLAAAEQK